MFFFLPRGGSALHRQSRVPRQPYFFPDGKPLIFEELYKATDDTAFTRIKGLQSSELIDIISTICHALASGRTGGKYGYFVVGVPRWERIVQLCEDELAWRACENAKRFPDPGTLARCTNAELLEAQKALRMSLKTCDDPEKRTLLNLCNTEIINRRAARTMPPPMEGEGDE